MSTEQAKKTRIPALDYIRSLALAAVVWIHTAPDDLPMGWKECTTAFCHVGVPMFLMLSGALVLGRFADDALTLRKVCCFYLKKLPRFVLLLAFWAMMTDAVYYLVVEKECVTDVLSHVWASNGLYDGQHFMGAGLKAGFHLWYMYEIILLYLAAPFLGRLVGVLGRSRLLAIMVCGALLFPLLREKYFPLSGFLGTRVCFILYFLFGYLVVQMQLFRTHRAVIGASLIAFGSLAWLLWQQFHGVAVWYVHVSIFLLSCSLFTILMFVLERARRRLWVETVSLCSFGVYLSHLAVRIVVTHTPINNMLGCFPCHEYVMTCAVSLLLTWGMLKSRMLKMLVS